MKMFCCLLLCLSLLARWFGSVSGSPAVDEVYAAVVGVLSPGGQNLTGETLRTLFNTLENRVQCGEVSCEKCNLTDAVHQLISNHSVHAEDESTKSGLNYTVSVSEFPAVAAGSVLYLSSPGLVCAAVGKGRWGEETDHFLHEVTHGDCHDHHHHHHGKSEHCDDHGHENMDVHGLETLLHELNHHYEPSENEGCVTASDIMTEVGAPSADQKQAVGAVLGRVLYHALLGHCFVSLPEEGFFLDYIMDRLGSENFTVEDLEGLMGTLSLGPSSEDHEHEHEHEHHDHTVGRRRKRSSHEHHVGNVRNTTWEQRCFSAEELVLIYGLPGNSSASSVLSRSDLARLSPALVQQILSGACALTGAAEQDGLSTTERYLYATLANVFITLTSMLGILLLMCTKCTSVFQLCVQFCISLAVGSLTGDALLHLLPMFLGLHDHSGQNHSSHDHEESSDYLYKMLVVMGGIYSFYLMETIFSLVTSNHHHHHHGEQAEPHHCDHAKVLELYQWSASKADLIGSDDNQNSIPERTKGQRLLPYLITLGDGIHNFADGLAMGAAFSLSWKSGLSTSLAVLCHELPHELGDFAILLHSGMSVRKALLLNVGSALTSFIGLYIALSVATDLATKQWIAAVTAGLFLYVGLADMLPTMVHINYKRPWMMFLLQNVGLLSGWSILLLLSLYEERISF